MSERTNCWKCGNPIPDTGQCDCPLPGAPENPLGVRVGDVLTAQAKYVALPINFNVASVVVPASVGAQCLFGWTITSSVQAAGRIRVRDGSSPNSPIIGVGSWAANGESSRWFGDQGINLLNNAIWLDPLGGSLEGAVYYV